LLVIAGRSCRRRRAAPLDPLPVGTTVAGIAVIKGKGTSRWIPCSRSRTAPSSRRRRAVGRSRLRPPRKAARIDVRVPYQDARWEGLLAGLPRRRTPGVRGSAPAAVVNLLAPRIGATSSGLRAAHPVDTVVGAAVAATLRSVDTTMSGRSTGRQPLLDHAAAGVVHTRGAWSYELTGPRLLH